MVPTEIGMIAAVPEACPLLLLTNTPVATGLATPMVSRPVTKVPRVTSMSMDVLEIVLDTTVAVDRLYSSSL
jgi:hypothetical protein